MAFRVTFLAAFVEEAGLMVNLGARLVALVTVLLAFGCVALVVTLMLVLGCLAIKVIFLEVGAALRAGVRLLVARLAALALRLGVDLVVAFG